MTSPVAALTTRMESVPVAWANAWARAPAEVHYKGATYGKSSAVSPEKRAWYLAAAALEDPDAVARMAPYQVDPNGEGGAFLDADPADLNAARSDLAQKQAALTSARQKVQTYLGEQKKWEEERKRKWAIDIPGQLFADAKIGWYKDQIEQQRLAMTGAQSDVTAAQAALQNAQRAYDDANRQIRQQEEQARQAALAEQQAAQQRAAQDAAARDAAAQAASAAYWSMPSSGGGNYYPGSDALLGAAQGEVWDPFAGVQGMNEEWVEDGTPFGADKAELVDTIDMQGGGDPEEALGHLRAMGEDVPGLTRHKSAWAFERYYDGPTEPVDRMFGPRIAGLGADHDASASGGGASDAFAVVGRILAAVLQAAPEIVKSAQSPSPSSVQSAAPGNGMESVTREILDVTGINKILDEKADTAAKTAGRKAGEGAQSGGLFIAVGLIALALILSKPKAAPAAAGA